MTDHASTTSQQKIGPLTQNDNNKHTGRLGTGSVTQTGGSAKSIIININKLAEMTLEKTQVQKGMSNREIENTLTKTLINALKKYRNVLPIKNIIPL